MHPYRVPEHHVGVLDRAVGLSPCRKSCSTCMLVRIVSGRVTLCWVVGGDPEVFRNKPCTLTNAGLWMREGQDVFARHQFVAHWLADSVKDGRVDHLPVTTGQWIDHLLRLRLGVHDARHLDFELNGAVLVEIPEVAILVVADSGDEGDDQAPRAPHLRLIRAPIDMLP